MYQLKVTVPEGLDTLIIQQIQSIENELDLALARINYKRVGTDKMHEEIVFHYQKQLNGAQPS